MNKNITFPNIKDDEIVFHKRGLKEFSFKLARGFILGWHFTQVVKPYWWEFWYRLRDKEKTRKIRIKKHVVYIGGIDITKDNQKSWSKFINGFNKMRDQRWKRRNLKEKYIYEDYTIMSQITVGMLRDELEKLNNEFERQNLANTREKRLKKLLDGK